MSSSEVYKSTHTYLSGLTVNWVIICVAAMLPIILAPLLNRQWVPMIRIIEIFLLIAYLRSNRLREKPLCMRPIYIIISMMILVSIITIIFNLLHVKWLFGPEPTDSIKFHNDILLHLPYLNIMITAPVMTLACLWSIISGHKSTFCLECRLRYAVASDDGFIGHLLRKESAYQIRSLFYIGLFLTIVEWTYYLVFFINVNINTPDSFMFTILPCAIFILSIVYMAGRYINFGTHFDAMCRRSNECSDRIQIRYLILHNGLVLLTDEETALIKGELVDTPAIVTLHNTHRVNEEEARRRFTEISGISDFSMRYVYRSTGCNAPYRVFHYAVTLNTPDLPEKARIKGNWYNAMHIERLIHSGMVSPQFAGAFGRIYTITMAWKTYDAQGHRLYAIKQYRPTFNLKDFNEWSVDYDDARWINIAYNNQDSKMYRLRKLWQRYVRSIGC